MAILSLKKWAYMTKCAYFRDVCSNVTKMCLKSPISLLSIGDMGLYKVLNKDFSSFCTHSLMQIKFYL